MDLAIFHICLIVSQRYKSSNERMPSRMHTEIDMSAAEML